MATLKIDLLVDKEKNRVVFAESGGDFVDILFSFLTLPIGSVIRLLGKQSSVGCLDKLYQSVENLDTKFLETEACRTLLLQPRNSAEAQCENLKINIDGSKAEMYACFWEHKYSLICNLRCPNSCDKLMSSPIRRFKAVGKNGVFVEGTARFMIRDDFQIMPLSTASTIAALQQFDVKNAASLVRKTVDIGKDEVLSLLKMTLLSKSPLSDVFLKKPMSNISIAADHNFIGINLAKIKTEENQKNVTDSKKIHMKILYSILSNKFLHAEIGDDLADLLFGFLTFPLGSVVRILNKDSSLGCLDTLYKSVECLDIGDYILSKEDKEMLLSPNLYLHHSCHDALVKIDETCPARWSKKSIIDPKLPHSVVKKGGFAKRLTKFVVSEDMFVSPFSSFSTIDIYKGFNEPTISLAEMDVSIGEAEALVLLKACLVSLAPMKELFFAKQGRKA